MKPASLTEAQRREIWHHMRTPAYAFVALMLLLATVVALGEFAPSLAASMVEGVLLACMVLVVLLFSMEVLEEPPLLRFFAGLGFVWVAALFTMTLLDYFTR